MFDRVFTSYMLLGKRGAYYWKSPSSGIFSWGTFKTKKLARERLKKFLDSF